MNYTICLYDPVGLHETQSILISPIVSAMNVSDTWLRAGGPYVCSIPLSPLPPVGVSFLLLSPVSIIQFIESFC